jgi:hypothetical protein
MHSGYISRKTRKLAAERTRNTRSEAQAAPHASTAFQRVTSDPGNASSSDILSLQRTAGNRAVNSLLDGAPVQAKLTVGPVGDVYEQEADRVAREVTSGPTARRKLDEGEDDQIRTAPVIRRFPLRRSRTVQGSPLPGQRVQRHPSHAKEEELELQGKREPGSFGAEGGETGPELESKIQSARGGGRPLEAGFGQTMSSRFAADFSGVRVHTDSTAHQLNRSLDAKAFTVGQDMFFRSGEYNPGSSGGQQLIAHELTHVVQQSRGEVQRKHKVQRAGEEHIQRKGLKNVKGFFKRLFHVGKKRREGKMTQKYGVNIGGRGQGKAHFSHGMMDKIEKVLKSLPGFHTAGNTALKGIEQAQGADREEMGAASFYSSGPEKVYMNRPFKWMPWWMYTMLSPKHKTQRKQMDKGAMEGYSGVSEERDRSLGLNTDERSVFAGVSKVAVKQGGLATQTLRHELGHGVDNKIKFTRTRAGLPVFGGWHSYKTEDQIASVVKVFLGYLKEKSTKNLDDWTPEGNAQVISMRLKQPNLKAELTEKLGKVKRSLQIGVSQPWTFSDGKAGELEVNGRVYQRDHYERWSSYLLSQRQFAVSNYQFSSPGEWFAEAYTSYYDPHPNSPARAKLNEPTRMWFAKNLGDYRQIPGQKGTLEDKSGKLQELLPFEGQGKFDEANEDTELEVLSQSMPEVFEALLDLNDMQEFSEDIAPNG